MALVVPVVFFLIFAEIFATAAGDQLQLRIAIVDEVHTDESARLLEALTSVPAIRPVPGALTRETARDLVRSGTADVGLVIRADGEDLATASGLAAPPLLLLGGSLPQRDGHGAGRPAATGLFHCPPRPGRGSGGRAHRH